MAKDKDQKAEAKGKGEQKASQKAAPQQARGVVPGSGVHRDDPVREPGLGRERCQRAWEPRGPVVRDEDDGDRHRDGGRAFGGRALRVRQWYVVRNSPCDRDARGAGSHCHEVQTRRAGDPLRRRASSASGAPAR